MNGPNDGAFFVACEIIAYALQKLKLKLSFLTVKGTYEGIGAIYPPSTMGG